MRRLRPALVALAVILALAGCRRRAAHGTVRVAAAADLQRAFEELGPRFTRQTGHPVAFTFGSSGLLAKQIAEGAPFDLYAAANASYVGQVVDAGACDGSTRQLYAQGRIVIWSTHEKVRDLAALAEPRFRKIAIANPDHAPYGKAAKQALTRAGVVDAITPKLVFGENVQQAKQFADTGSAEAAIVALSLVTAGAGGEVTPIDPSLHDPLDQQLVACGHGPGAAGARAFIAYLGSAEGREVMRRYGFKLPGE